MKNLWKSIFPLLLVLLLAACQEKQPEKKPEELIAKSWRLDKMSMADEMVNPAIMGTSTFTFFKNGRYEILMGELERGKWSLSADKKVLITVRDGGNMQGEMDIVELKEDKLIMTNTGNERPMTLTLVPQ
jgi:hypothetical protein